MGSRTHPSPDTCQSPAGAAGRIAAAVVPRGGKVPTPERVTIRLGPALLRRLDAFARLRALTRAEAVRVALLEATMTPVERQRLPDRDEILHLASDKARTIGSVPAMRLVLQELRRDGSEPKRSRSAIDELAARRGRGAGGRRER